MKCTFAKLRTLKTIHPIFETILYIIRIEVQNNSITKPSLIVTE